MDLDGSLEYIPDNRFLVVHEKNGESIPRAFNISHIRAIWPSGEYSSWVQTADSTYHVAEAFHDLMAELGVEY